MSTDKPASTPEPEPIARTDEAALWPLVMSDAEARLRHGMGSLRGVQDLLADMRDRDSFGREKYGTPLQAGNGRDALVDAYQEILDACVYLKQALVEGVVSATHEIEYYTLIDMAFWLRGTIAKRATTASPSTGARRST